VDEVESLDRLPVVHSKTNCTIWKMHLHAGTYSPWSFTLWWQFSNNNNVSLLITHICEGTLQHVLWQTFRTTSILMPYRNRDTFPGSFTNWLLMSVHYWGEDPRAFAGTSMSVCNCLLWGVHRKGESHIHTGATKFLFTVCPLYSMGKDAYTV